MPWLSILLALIAFFTEKKRNGGDNTRAALAAGIVGAGSYYVTHETEWGKENLGFLDGVEASTVTDLAGPPVTKTNADGTLTSTYPNGTVRTTAADGTVKYVDAAGKTLATGTASAVTDVLKSWGPAGTAGVIGVTAAATSGNTKKYLLWGGLALVAFLILR